MSISYGSTPIKNGLVFYVDPANPKSYIGTGTAIDDIYGGTATGEVAGGATFSSANAGHFQFVTDDYLRFPNNTNLDTQTLTIEVWVKPNVVGSHNGFYFEKGTVNTQYSIFQGGTSLIFRTFLGGISDLTVTTATYMTAGEWYQVVGTYTSGDKRLYINGTQVNSNGVTGTVSTNSGGMSMGAYGGYSGSRSYYLNGNLSLCRVYNRVLTQEEIQHNFIVNKGRFGL